MTLALRKAAASANAAAISVRQGGAVKDVKSAHIRVGGALKQFYSPLTVTLDKSNVVGRVYSSGGRVAYTDTVTASVTGAVPPVEYAWTRTSPDGHAWTIGGSATAKAQFSTITNPGENWFATFVCTVTDAAGMVAVSDEVTADCSNDWFGSSGGPLP